MSSRTLALIALVAPLAAAEPPAGWQVEASPAFATTGDIKGPAAGWNEVRQLYSYNTQCGYGSGFNIRLGTGLAVAATEHLLLGVRAAVRPPAYSAYCLAMAGPWSFGSSVLSSVGPTVSLRF